VFFFQWEGTKRDGGKEVEAVPSFMYCAHLQKLQSGPSLGNLPITSFKCQQSSLISSCCGGKPTHNTHYFPSCII
jgi:hypothetical protein